MLCQSFRRPTGNDSSYLGQTLEPTRMRFFFTPDLIRGHKEPLIGDDASRRATTGFLLTSCRDTGWVPSRGSDRSRFGAGRQAGHCARRRTWPSWDTGRRAAAQAGAARSWPALLAHRVRRPTRRRGPGAPPPARTNAARQRDRAACAEGQVAPERFGSRAGSRAFDRGAAIAIPRQPPMDRRTGSGRFARPGRRRP